MTRHHLALAPLEGHRDARYEKISATRRAKRQERIAEFEFLLEGRVATEEAALRAGWPSIEAAEITLRREHHPRAAELARIIRRHRRQTKRAA
ncbi:hypothetical protein [Sinomonas soli]